eukprot:TRINITY_DN110679_c0_g1_i1.p1 TRINITY_DN110679_c0_g1~~TRINITY_DN110679_c0_g1_i1.p1  ORF type:complete len:1004 (+),score=243.42 TRINITY_DN110679_c0_g1_i1:95-3106(+)
MAVAMAMPSDSVMKPAMRHEPQGSFQQLVMGCNKEGMDFLRRGQYKQAFEQLKYAEAVLVEKEGEDEPTNLLAVTCNNLGCYYKKVGKLHAALSYLRKALKIEVSLQTDDVTVAGTHLNICAILSKLDKHDKAVQHALCALELIGRRVNSGEAVSQDEYSVLAIAYHNVAVERDYLHQWEQAAMAYQQGHQVAKECLGDQHPLTQTLAKNSETAAQKAQKFASQQPGAAAAAQAAAGGAVSSTAMGRPSGVSKTGGSVNMGGKSLMQDSQQASVGLLPEIGATRSKEGRRSQEEPMPINVGRSVHQEAEEWVQTEESTWRQQQAQATQAAGAAASPVSHSSQFTPPGLGLAPSTPRSLAGIGLQSLGAAGASPAMAPVSVAEEPQVMMGGLASPPDNPWAQDRPSFLDTIAQDVRALHRDAPIEPPPLVVMGKQERQMQRPPKASPDAENKLSADQDLVFEMGARAPRPPRAAGGPPMAPQKPEGPPPQANGRSKGPKGRAEREAARRKAKEVAKHNDPAGLKSSQGAETTGTQNQLLRRTAAEKIQRSWRVFNKYRLEHKARQERERIAATKLQARWRAFNTRRGRLTKHVVVIQKWTRGFLVRIAIRRYQAAVVIQRHAAGVLARKEKDRKDMAALKLQRISRGRAARKKCKAHRRAVDMAVAVIQRAARAWKAVKVVKKKRDELEAVKARDRAAQAIQAVYRGSITRFSVRQLRHGLLKEQEREMASTKIQAMARRVQAVKYVDSLRQSRMQVMHRAATTIRKHWLRFLCRRRYMDLKREYKTHEKSIVTMQRYVRGYIVRLRMWREAIRAEEELWASVEIQRCWRGHLGRLRWELAYEALWSREAAAHRLQRYVRGWLARTRVHRLRKRMARAEFLKARRRFKAAQKIQALARSFQARQRVWMFRRKRVEAATRIQKVWRGHTLRRTLWSQVVARRIVQIQAVARGFLVRNRRYKFLAKVILIQRFYRHWLRFIPEAERRRRHKRWRLRRPARPAQIEG